jgi:hypothetical protein
MLSYERSAGVRRVEMAIAFYCASTRLLGLWSSIGISFWRDRAVDANCVRVGSSWWSKSLAQSLAHCDDFDVSVAAEDVDAYCIGVALAGDVDAAAADFEIANADVLELLRQCGVMHVEARFVCLDFDTETCLKDHEHGAGGPCLR